VVRDGHGTVAGVAITLIDAHGDVAAAGVTDGSGRYQLVGVPEGAYTLTAASPGYQPVAVGLRLDVGVNAERDLDLPQRSRLVGTVTAVGSGRPVEEATATLLDAGGTVVGAAVTGQDGTFAFGDLPAGTYTLTTRGYAPVAQTVRVAAGTQATADVRLGTGHRQAGGAAPGPQEADAGEPATAGPVPH
jgi:Carboxypeptidase regulatory-like domain